jgi:hypothetical protein
MATHTAPYQHEISPTFDRIRQISFRNGPCERAEPRSQACLLIERENGLRKWVMDGR